MYNPSEQEIYDAPQQKQEDYVFTEDELMRMNGVDGAQVQQPTTEVKPAVVDQPAVVNQPATEKLDIVDPSKDPKAARPAIVPITAQGSNTTTAAGTQQQEEKPVVTDKPMYLVDWANTNARDAYNKTGLPMYDLIMDQQKWAQDNNQPFRMTDWMGMTKDQDIHKSKEENERDARRAKAKERLDAVGNFLAHLGNFVGAAGWGGSVKLEDPVQYTERQRKLREHTLELRNGYNKDLFAQMAKEQADARDYELKKKKALGDAGLVEAKVNEAKENTRRRNEESQARVGYINQRTANEKNIGPEKVKESQSRQSANYSRANSYSSRVSTGGRRRNNTTGRGASDPHDEWAQNIKDYPTEAAAFKKQNNIHGNDQKSWSLEQIKQFNALVRNKRNNGVKPAKKTKADYSQYKVNK